VLTKNSMTRSERFQRLLWCRVAPSYHNGSTARDSAFLNVISANIKWSTVSFPNLSVAV